MCSCRAGRDGHAKLYRTDTGAFLGEVSGLSGEPVLDASFSPDGRTVAVSTQDGTLTLVDVATRRPTGSPIEPGAPVGNTIWSPDGTRLALTSEFTEAVRIWSVADRRWLATFAPSAGGTLSAAFSPDGALLVTGERDGRLHLYDAVTWRQLGDPVLMGAGSILSASFSARWTVSGHGRHGRHDPAAGRAEP